MFILSEEDKKGRHRKTVRMKKIFLMCLLLSCVLFIQTIALAGAEEKTRYLEDMTNEEIGTYLIGQALEKGYLPENPHEFNFSEELDKGNMIGTWASMRWEEKGDSVAGIMKVLNNKEVDQLPSEYYVREIDIFYCNVLLGRTCSPETDANMPVITLIKVIATMDGEGVILEKSKDL